jgi:type IV secretory pathway TraG/TraD family ATPase VirD4
LPKYPLKSFSKEWIFKTYTMNLFNYIIHSDLQTKIFIVISLFVLSFIQFKILKIKKFKWIVLILLQSLFGFLLSFVTVYSIIVHLVVYIFPSFLIAFIIYKITFTPDDDNEIAFSFYLTSKRKYLKISENGIFRHFGVFGGTGAGKTKSILKFTIKQMAKLNMSGVIVDYKYYDLVKAAYTHYLDSNVKFLPVNSVDLSRSLQCNPISPNYIKDPEDAIEAASSIIANLARASKDGFWIDAGESILAGCIWKFKEDLPDKCFLPYITATISRSTSATLINFLSTNMQAQELAMPYFKAINNDRTLGNIETTVANALRKISVKKISWLLSGDDINFHLNDPKKPSILCLSNNMQADSSYSPILALILSTAARVMTKPNQNYSGFIVDEASRIKFPDLEKTVSALREYKIFFMMCMQDIAQGKRIYTDSWRSILNNFNNQFYGNTSDQESAEMYARMYGKVYKSFKSKTKRKHEITASSISVSDRQVYIKEPNEFLNMPAGNFFGLTKNSNMVSFDETFQMYEDEEFDIPVINPNVDDDIIKENFESIIHETEELLKPFIPEEEPQPKRRFNPEID